MFCECLDKTKHEFQTHKHFSQCSFVEMQAIILVYDYDYGYSLQTAPSFH